MCFKYNPIVSPIAPPSKKNPSDKPLSLQSPAELSYLTGKPSIAPDDSLPKVSDQVLAIGVFALETNSSIHGEPWKNFANEIGKKTWCFIHQMGKKNIYCSE